MAGVGDIYEVQEIVGRRRTKEGREDYLVRWLNYPPSSTTWEPLTNLDSCHEAVQDYFSKYWPIPGAQATSVVHLSENLQPPKRKELITLQALPVNKRNKILRGVRKDLKDEILRHQGNKESSLSDRNMEKVDSLIPDNYNQKLRNRTLRNRTRAATFSEIRQMTRDKNGKFTGKIFFSDNNNGTIVDKTLESSSILKEKQGRPRKAKNMKLESPNILQKQFKLEEEQEDLLLSVKMQYNQLQESVTTKVSPKKKRRNGFVQSHTFPQQKNRIVIDSPTLSLPSRLTRQTLPDYSSHCILDEEVVVNNRGGCLHIKICNEAKKNVINRQICEDIISALHDAGKDDVSLVVISCSGSTFSYGWDLEQFQTISHPERRELLQKYRLLTRLLITCPKPLIAAVNGPAAGFGFSLVTLCDSVFASEKATFQTKFVEWGHPPVGCGSFTLSQILGPTQAISLVLFNKKITSEAAKHCGLVTEVVPSDQFEEEIESRIGKLSSIPLQCVRDTKTLFLSGKIQELEDRNHEECDLFQKYIVNDNTLNDIITRWRSSIRE